MNKQMSNNPERVGGGVFLIGLAFAFLFDFIWPGIMFVIAASIIASTMSQGKPWQSATGAFIVGGIGMIFWLPGAFFNGLFLPLLLMGIGALLLFSKGDSREFRFDFDFNWDRDDSEKVKNDAA